MSVLKPCSNVKDLFATLRKQPSGALTLPVLDQLQDIFEGWRIDDFDRFRQLELAAYIRRVGDAAVFTSDEVLDAVIRELFAMIEMVKLTAAEVPPEEVTPESLTELWGDGVAAKPEPTASAESAEMLALNLAPPSLWAIVTAPWVRASRFDRPAIAVGACDVFRVLLLACIPELVIQTYFDPKWVQWQLVIILYGLIPLLVGCYGAWGYAASGPRKRQRIQQIRLRWAACGAVVMAGYMAVLSVWLPGGSSEHPVAAWPLVHALLMGAACGFVAGDRICAVDTKG